MRFAKVPHNILQVAEVLENVFADFSHCFAFGWWCDRYAVGGVDFDFAAFLGHASVGRRGVPRDEGGDHDKEKDGGEGEHGKEFGVEADEGEDCHCGVGVHGVGPREDSVELMLECKDYADSVIHTHQHPTLPPPIPLHFKISHLGGIGGGGCCMYIPWNKLSKIATHQCQAKRWPILILPLMALLTHAGVLLDVVVVRHHRLQHL